MIVKKMPIFQGFPDFESVKNLSKYCISCTDFRPVFYDIETTGLSQYSSFLYLVGAVTYEDGQWILYQWFGENESEEPEVLSAFSDFLTKDSVTIQYNGNRFDQPYLETRFQVHNMSSPFPGLLSIDLYQVLKPCKDLLKLPGMKQPDLEVFLHLPSRLFCNGKDGIRCFHKYQKTHDTDIMQELLGHNQEDLMGLGSVFCMLSYLCLYTGMYEPVHAEINDDLLLLTLRLPHPLPVLFSNGNSQFYITGEADSLRLMIPLTGGRLRQYYANYRDYDYIPTEDTAIPKSLSSYMDRSLRVPARRDTCYTWFCCDEIFLSNTAKQMQYLRHTLPYLLSTLKK